MALQGFAMSKRNIDEALAQDGMMLDDFESTYFGCVWDGVEWQCLEDSLEDEDDALRWAKQAESYGEHVGLYHWVVA